MPIIQGRDLKLVRMRMWMDQIKKNLLTIENKLHDWDMSITYKQLEEQYRLISVLRDAISNDALLQGSKVVQQIDVDGANNIAGG